LNNKTLQKENLIDLTTVRNIERILLESLDFEDVIGTIVSAILTKLGYMQLGYRIAVLTLINKKKGVLERVSLSETSEAKKTLKASPKKFENIEIPLDFKDNASIKAINSGHMQIVTDFKYILCPELSIEEARQVQKAAGIKTSVVIPMKVRGEIIGTMIFSMIKEKEKITENEKELLKYFEKIDPKIKSNLSVVPDDIADDVRAKFSGKAVSPKAKEKKKPRPKAEFKVRKKRVEPPPEETKAEVPEVSEAETKKEKPAAKTGKEPAEVLPGPVTEETPSQETAAPEPVSAEKPSGVQEAPSAVLPVAKVPMTTEPIPAAKEGEAKPKLKKKEKKKGKKAEVEEKVEVVGHEFKDKGKGKKGKITIRADKIERPIRKSKKILPVQLLELQVRRTPKKLRTKAKKKPPRQEREKIVQETAPAEARKNVIRWDETTTVKDVAERLNIPVNNLILKFMEMGVMVTVNKLVDPEELTVIAHDYGYEVDQVSLETAETLLEEIKDNPEHLVIRPPVVTIMGHVDHGKTSLLDVIRQSKVVEGEAGGITQHIGAYTVHLNDRSITFLDTPGHEAFTSMRARGAKVTDIVILVVAADDGVMPQTVEAINHAAAAKVPVVVAINKIDKPDAKPEKVKQELSEHNLISEEWGGKTIFVEVSAKKKIHIDRLLEMILLQSEIMELRADPDRPARGTIIEARLDKSKGPVATVLVQTGTVKVGDPFVSGVYHGKVRAMLNDLGKKISSAGPSMPVEITGLSGVPMAGETFVVVSDERKARQIGMARSIRMREAALAKGHRVTLDDLFQRIQKGEVKELPIIIKGDVQGSVEALSDTLERLSTQAVELKVIHGSVGGITETDVNLAAASNAIIIGFNVRPEPKAALLAEAEAVDIRLYNVIYDASNDVRKAMEGLLEPTLKERSLGRAEIRDVIPVPKVGNVAGCYVMDGKVQRDAHVRLIRDNVVVYEGKISSLRRFKDDVKEVAAGFECGIGIENYNDIKLKDIIEIYTFDKVATKL